MGFDINARQLGYPNSAHWLTIAASELAFGVIIPERLTEYDLIFRAERRPITRQESGLLAALDDPADWDWLEANGHLTATGELTKEATDMKYRALAVGEEASRFRGANW